MFFISIVPIKKPAANSRNFNSQKHFPSKEKKSAPTLAGARQFDCSMGPLVIGLHFLEEVQHMLCAIGRPYRKQMMIGVLEGAAATHRDEPGVSLLW